MIRFFSLVIFAMLPVTGDLAAETGRSVAITIDDLPVVTRQKSEKVKKRITSRLLKHIKDAKAPVIGFVNERKLFTDDVLNPERVDYLRQWLDAGCELGNHTYSHRSLHDIDFETYSADILKGEKVTKELFREYGREMRYFRHPYLQTGLSLEIKVRLNDFLSDHKYTIAPVSIDTSDWAFSAAYDAAVIKGDKKLKKRIGKAYVPYIEDKTAYFESQSRMLFEREIRQILLIHANAINADYLDDVLQMYKARGYEIITLESALEDKAYQNPDTFTRRAGISWLHRWALARGKEYLVPNEPRVPKFVMEAAGITSE